MTGTQRIDGAAIVEEQTAAVRVLADTVAVFERIEVPLDEIICRQVQIGGQGNDLVLGNINGSRFTCTASTAPLALETDAGVKKIGALRQVIQGFAVHKISISDPRCHFNCNGLFT